MKVLCICLILLNIVLTYCNLNGEGRVCGRPLGTGFKYREEKIVAGYDVGYYRYPWFVALMTADIIACGGTLIGAKVIVSAAHCYKEYIVGHGNNTRKLEDVYVAMLGMYNKCEKEKTQKAIKIDKVYIHEKYKSNWPYYDISLLVLKESASSYQPICLPKSIIKTRPKEGTAPGMGTLKYHGSTPCTLHEARILIYPDEECRKMINRTGNDPTKVFRAFCAGYLQGGIDTCQGDSGGPLQITDEYGSNILLGLVSFGFHCANPGLLGMYTDVSQYVDWIEEKAGFKATIDGSNSTVTSTYNETLPTTDKPTTNPLPTDKPITKPLPTGKPITKPLPTDKPISKPRPPGKPVSKPHKIHMFAPPFLRPINIIILRNNKLAALRKKVRHHPKGKNTN